MCLHGLLFDPVEAEYSSETSVNIYQTAWGHILEVNSSTKQQSPLAGCFLTVTCLAYTLIMKMEAVRSSETSVNLYRTIRRLVSETGCLQDILFKWDKANWACRETWIRVE
jgi:hypothetical protein